MCNGICRGLFAVAVGAIACFGAARAEAYVLVADYFGDKVDLRDEHTGALIQSGFIPAGSAGLSHPAGIAVGADNRVYVSSSYTNQILVYDGSTGEPIATAPGGNGVYGVLDSGAVPNGLTFDSTGKLYVADNASDKLYVFDGATASYATTVSVPLSAPGTLGGVAYHNGQFYVSGLGSSEVLVGNGSSFSSLVAPYAGGLAWASGLSVAGDGSLYVAGLFTNEIHHFDTNGNPAAIPGLAGGATAIDIPFAIPPIASFSTNAPSGVAFAEDGDLLISCLGPVHPGELDPNTNVDLYPLGSLLRYDFGTGDLTTLGYPIPAASAIALTPVPEPATLGLLAAAGVAIIAARYGRRAMRRSKTE